MKEIGKPKQGNELVTPRIKNVDELIDEIRRPLLLHFTSEQWKPIREDMESGGAIDRVESIPEGQGVLEIVPLLGKGEGALIGVGRCPPGCTQLEGWHCINPDDYTCVLVPNCFCDPPPPPTPPLSRCRANVIFISGGPYGVRGTFQLACVDSTGNQCADFKPVFVRQADGSMLLTCVPR